MMPTMQDAQTADWDFAEITEDERELIDREHANAPEEAACVLIRSNACLHSLVRESEPPKHSWELKARVLLRSVCGEYRAVEFSAEVPYRPMTVEQAKEKWEGILLQYFVSDWLPAYGMGLFDD